MFSCQRACLPEDFIHAALLSSSSPPPNWKNQDPFPPVWTSTTALLHVRSTPMLCKDDPCRSPKVKTSFHTSYQRELTEPRVRSAASTLTSGLVLLCSREIANGIPRKILRFNTDFNTPSSCLKLSDHHCMLLYEAMMIFKIWFLDWCFRAITFVVFNLKECDLDNFHFFSCSIRTWSWYVEFLECRTFSSIDFRFQNITTQRKFFLSCVSQFLLLFSRSITSKLQSPNSCSFSCFPFAHCVHCFHAFSLPVFWVCNWHKQMLFPRHKQDEV